MNILQKIISGIRKIMGSSVYYVNGSDTLPPPLTKQEEEAVFAALTENSPEAFASGL